jgi:hypothetical protein
LELTKPSILLTLLALLGGCSDDAASSSDARGAGGSEPSTAGSNGVGASAGAGAVGGGGPSGTLVNAHPVMFEPSGSQISGISLTGDELELYYARNYDGFSIMRARRPATTEPFGYPEYLAELVNVCGQNQRANPDVSGDGLSLYITCTQLVDVGMSEGISTLRVARRPDRSSAFVLEPEPVGGVYASAGISADELVAYTDGEIFNTAPRMFMRASKTESFGEPQAVPGITEPLNSLDISDDGLALFGSTTLSEASDTTIFRALRADPDGPFGALEPLDFELAGFNGKPAIGAPNITPSGTLYLIGAVPFVSFIVYAAPLE